MKILAAVVLCVCCAAGAQAATVYLTDGSVLKGTIQSADKSGLELSTANGTLHISAGQISQVDYSGDEPRLWPPGAQEATPRAPAAPQPQAQPQPQEEQAPQPEYQPTPPGSGYVPYRRRRFYYVEPEEEDNFKQELTLDLGGAGPLTDIDMTSVGGGTGSNGAPGVLVGFQYLYYKTPQLGIGLTFDYIGRGDAYSDGLLPSYVSDTYGDTEMFLATVKYRFTQEGAARPYISFGFGVADNSTVLNARPQYGYGWPDTDTGEWRQLVNDNVWVPAASIKLGLDLAVWGPYTTSLEVGWTGLGSATYGATPAGQAIGISNVSGPLNFITGGVRWGWKF